MIAIRDFVYSELDEEDFINLDAMNYVGRFYEEEEWLARMSRIQLTRLDMLAVIESIQVPAFDGPKIYYKVTDLGDEMVDWWTEAKMKEEENEEPKN